MGKYLCIEFKQKNEYISSFFFFFLWNHHLYAWEDPEDSKKELDENSSSCSAGFIDYLVYADFAALGDSCSVVYLFFYVSRPLISLDFEKSADGH